MDSSAKIATLGRLCGIAPEYWDNAGVRRLTSQATYQSLLTAMDVPWEDPEQLVTEIARRKAGGVVPPGGCSALPACVPAAAAAPATYAIPR